MAAITLDSGKTLQVADLLYAFVRDEVLPGTGLTAEQTFQSLGRLLEQFAPPNRELLAQRQAVQQRIDDYYIAKRAAAWQPSPQTADSDAADLERFLVEIGYLPAAPAAGFTMTTPPLDAEMDQNGPELVTPVTNASMAVGGANARWGSLYDAYFLSGHPPGNRPGHPPRRPLAYGGGPKPTASSTNTWPPGRTAYPLTTSPPTK